jgi:Ca2+-binding EF-hand superfamily protein
MGSRMFERADADKNGTLTKAEMETAAADMFKKRDRNGDGFITADEIGKRHKK